MEKLQTFKPIKIQHLTYPFLAMPIMTYTLPLRNTIDKTISNIRVKVIMLSGHCILQFILDNTKSIKNFTCYQQSYRKIHLLFIFLFFRWEAHLFPIHISQLNEEKTLPGCFIQLPIQWI